MPERVAVYDSAKVAAISIPGHARYFENRRREARARVVDILHDTDYERVCEELIQTLQHLPSPETVWVLGALLEDESDELSEEQRQKRDGAWDMRVHRPTLMGAETLRYIGLRGFAAPAGDPSDYTGEEYQKLRTWWTEVKSGSKPFSFKGEAVEYLFKPDGTWETVSMVNPPDDAPAIPAAPAREKPVNRPPPAKVVENPKPVGNSWALIVGAVIATLGGLVWFGARKFKGNG